MSKGRSVVVNEALAYNYVGCVSIVAKGKDIISLFCKLNGLRGDNLAGSGIYVVDN